MQIRAGQVIAIGGGGFGAGPENLAIDRYILAQARDIDPAIAFLPTASADADPYIVAFYAAYTGLGCRPSHLPLFRRTPDLRAYLLAQDIIYVGGGNTKSMLAVWREWGVPELLREACDAGTVLAGISAGAICWFEEGLTDSYADGLHPLPGLGFLPGSCCPHYDGEPERRPTYHELLGRGEIAPGIAIDDGVAVHFIETDVHRVVGVRPGAAAYRVALVEGAVKEESLPPICPPPDR